MGSKLRKDKSFVPMPDDSPAARPIPQVLRGAARKSAVTDQMRQALERGEPSRTHIEQMSLDMGVLLASELPQLVDRAREFDGKGFIDRMRTGGRIVWEEYGTDVFALAPSWASDTMRGWAAFAISHSDSDIRTAVARARPFADDAHFAVREWAWLAVRPIVAADVMGALSALEEFTADPSPNLRRFACEITRPRGVWSAHLPALKADPSPALPLLEAIACDTHRYVQNSVANWFNDAAKTRPDWVTQTITDWSNVYGSRIAYVARRAKRSIPT